MKKQTNKEKFNNLKKELFIKQVDSELVSSRYKISTMVIGDKEYDIEAEILASGKVNLINTKCAFANRNDFMFKNSTPATLKAMAVMFLKAADLSRSLTK